MDLSDSFSPTSSITNTLPRDYFPKFWSVGPMLIFASIFFRDTSDPKDPGKRVKKSVSYCPLETALKPYSWGKLNRVQTKDLNPAVVFSVLGEYLPLF